MDTMLFWGVCFCFLCTSIYSKMFQDSLMVHSTSPFNVCGKSSSFIVTQSVVNMPIPRPTPEIFSQISGFGYNWLVWNQLYYLTNKYNSSLFWRMPEYKPKLTYLSSYSPSHREWSVWDQQKASPHPQLPNRCPVRHQHLELGSQGPAVHPALQGVIFWPSSGCAPLRWEPAFSSVILSPGSIP